MRKKLFLAVKILFLIITAILFGSAFGSVYAKGYTATYAGDGYYDSSMWNQYISGDVNTKPLYIYVDGMAKTGDFYMSRNMELMVPVRKITECFNCAENFYPENELVLQKKDIVLKFYKDQQNCYYKNDEKIDFNGVVEIVEDQMFIASSAITENFGFENYWDSQINTVDFATVWQDSIFPAYYNLRNEGRDTKVKNQGSHGTCWAVAALSALETTIRPEEELNFAAEHMALKNSFTKKVDDGGEYTMSMAYLLSWQGPVLEEDDPYGDMVSPDGLSPVKHVQEIQIIKDKNIDKIKQAVFKNGAVQTSIYTSLKNSLSRSKYYNREKYAYYYDGNEEQNHEIIIIGWDDNFSKDNFTVKPQNDGAFICQNSWGENFGDDGIFYISYEDTRIGQQSIVYSGIENTDNYDNIYQTDLCGWVGQIGYGRESCYFANVFTSKGNQKVKGVGFYITGDNSAYEVYKVSQYNNTEDLTDGELIAVGETENAGFYTVNINQPFSVTEDEKFAIVIRLYTPDAVHPVAVEYAVDGRCENVDLTDAEGYISPYGNDWVNVEKSYNCNVCMKVYTDNE